MQLIVGQQPHALVEGIAGYREREVRAAGLSGRDRIQLLVEGVAIEGRGAVIEQRVEHAAHTVLAFGLDRKSTRLNSSHPSISYAVFCLKKKITTILTTQSLCYPA